MISIILPVYNGERYLSQAIEGILNQTYSDWELIIVNDCSTDSTSSIIEEYLKDKRIRVIENKLNLKLPKSLNRGFQASRGEYLTWTSDDNIYNDTALETLLRTLQDAKDTALVYSDMYYIDEEGSILEREIDRYDIWQGNCVGACFLYRREIFEKLGGYDENLYLVEDYEYWLRIAKYYKMKFINRKLYYYRVHEQSLSTSKEREVTKKRIELLKGLLTDPDVPEEKKNDIKLQLIGDYYHEKDMQKLKSEVKLLKKHDRNVYHKLPYQIKKEAYFNRYVYVLGHRLKRILKNFGS